MHWFLSRRQVVTTGKDALSTQRQTVSFGGWAERGQRGVQNIVQAYISSYRWSHGGLASAWDLPRITLLLCGRISSALDSPGCQHISACTCGSPDEGAMAVDRHQAAGPASAGAAEALRQTPASLVPASTGTCTQRAELPQTHTSVWMRLLLMPSWRWGLLFVNILLLQKSQGFVV